MSPADSASTDLVKVLLVDDEEGYVSILSKRLARRNFEVTAAGGGAEGIQALRKQDFDVAVLDLKMEDMDGIEVLKVFKKMLPGMSVIMLTGHGSEQAAREGIQFGAFDYLTKPCDLEDLVEKILEARQGRGGDKGE
jgi:DNA-binding NtrC family response regulator